jgi:uncharacterized protein
MRLQILRGEFTIQKLDATAPIPEWATGGEFVSITRTRDELSIVCESPSGEWRCLKVEGLLNFSLVGILASLAEPLAKAGVPIFAISTFDTDHILVKAENLDRAIDALRSAGHTIA